MFICLTGGIASGKSALSAMLAERGTTVIDADAISRQLTAVGGQLVPVIDEAFPGVVSGGVIDREALGSIVFGDDEARAKLNGIMHPVIREEMDRQAAHAKGVVVMDIPLIIETGRGSEPAILIAVMADEATRIDRLIRDRGMTEAEARKRIAAQATDEERRTYADILIHNDRDLSDLEEQAAGLATRLGQIQACWEGAKIDGVPGDEVDAGRLARKIRYHGGTCEVEGTRVVVSSASRQALRTAGCVEHGRWMSAHVQGRIMVDIVGPADRLNG